MYTYHLDIFSDSSLITIHSFRQQMVQCSISADDISHAIISKYNSLSNKGKPVTKSNGVKEWTVLAGIVGLIQDETGDKSSISESSDSLDLIALSTGVKSLPDAVVKTKSMGRLLHDCHAEILTLRAFNRFIISECQKVDGGIESSSYIEKDDTTNRYKFKLKKGIRFSLYVSQLPCGDCSLSQVQGNTSEEPWGSKEERNGNDIQLPNGILRGREFYNIKGKVRTKPGRRDSPLTLSKSCCDKLSITQIKGLLSNVLSQFVNPDGFHLAHLVVPETEYSDITELTNSFHKRLSNTDSFKPFEILYTKNQSPVDKTDESQTPANLSLVYIPSVSVHESITNSVKEGYFNKKTYVRKGGESCLSRVKLFEEASRFVEITSELTYLDVKASNKNYLALKESAFTALGGWCKTATDDFEI
ncbi:hypothetical protein WICPIJ_009190 [Wickerhamomyces pijperi]|uniref:A to I editase domain-containing protein n=1 Tax=Wickerhamomyces pijperi TaxID=599730 RepID=A0A9P8PRH5_WICPI|nr:hypothetical protein WICPIJ_009190 [Wickerhamomyces pijperi]